MNCLRLINLKKKCDGKCIKMREKCNGECEWYQCETRDGHCLDPDQDRTKTEKKLGLFRFKNCQGKCIPVSDLCEDSCGDHVQFCWDSVEQKCQSTKEKTKVGILTL